MLGHYCNKFPRLHVSRRAGTKVGTMQILTRTYPIVLAYWAIDDGARTTQRIGLFTYKIIYICRSLYVSGYARL